jgi:hypothetical protein
VHCGAHLAEELEEYENVGWREVTWIEANPDLIPRLKVRVKDSNLSKILIAALWSTDGEELELKVASNSYSSSFLNFGSHAKTYPDVNFEKITNILGFKAKTNVVQGIQEIYLALKSGKVDSGPKTVTVQWYRNILDAKALVDSVTLDGRLI